MKAAIGGQARSDPDQADADAVSYGAALRLGPDVGPELQAALDLPLSFLVNDSS